VSAARSGAARFAAGASAAALLALAFWFLAVASVATQLDADAARREAAWRGGEPSPWRWRFAGPGDVVWPGSRGFAPEDAGTDGLAARLAQGEADVSLALRGERIDLALVTGAVVQLSSDEALEVALVGHAAREEILLGSARLPAGARTGLVPLGSDARRPLDALRLRLQTTAGARVALREVQLLAPQGAAPSACAFQPAVARWLEACPGRIPVVREAGLWRPESILLWRDRALAARPAAVVRAAADLPRGRAAVEWLRSAPGFLYWIAALLPLLAAATSYWRPSGSRRRAALELALVFLPALALLWCGQPERDTGLPAGLALAGSLVGGALLRDPLPRFRWLGDRAAWFGAGLVAAAAALLVGASALANALDTDGFAWRAVASDHAWRYPLWALLQQWILLRAIAPRARQLSGRAGGAALAAGALFALLHLPNLSLMLLTFAAGTAWAWLGLRHRALLPLAATHAALGLTLFAVVPEWLVRSAEVGGRFLMAP
jgi:hypothetical protein